MKFPFSFRSSRTSEIECTLYNADCMEVLEQLPDNSVDLTVTSPPYCLGKAYESTKDVADFTAFHKKILPEIVRITKPGGSICWQVGSHVVDRVLTPLDFLVYEICRDIGGLTLRNRIIWTYGHGLNETQRFTGRHETVLWFTKGDQYTFNLDAVRVPQKYPGKKYYKGPKKGEYSGNPLGKNPTDVWEIPNIKAQHKEKTIHPCQFPIALVHRLISGLSNPGDTVFDPFSGVGTTGATAMMLDRNFIGSELMKEYYEIAKSRIKQASDGTLPHRDVSVPLLDPSTTGAVAKKPDHFCWAN
ncbi:DNA-methyltransferase [Delftia lacustris]|uniref:DNA-methyltransferase n=1 Tax=Delftia lacustris TaxID=558537 RepID=UPI001FCB16D6|nr:site-specific DNA-methyltransferase [Delftia lacustris]